MAQNRSPAPELVRLTRNALAHLYDAAYLENHPLAMSFDATGRLDHVSRAQRLRRLLLDCLEALRPQRSDSATPEGARAYAILTYRYVDGIAMEEIAAKRALSERQAYRELERGLEAIAALVEERLPQAGRPLEPLAPIGGEAPEPQRDVAQAEVARLGQAVLLESLSARDVFRGILAMLEPLRERADVRTDLVAPDAWPLIVADRVLLRQAGLNLLSDAIHLIAPGTITVTAEPAGTLLRLELIGRPDAVRSDPAPLAGNEPDRVRLTIAEALVVAQGGRLEMVDEPERWRARLWFPTVARETILVVDDNRDLIALFQRYVGGRELVVVGAADSAQALRLAVELRPELIALDVMMPNLDGWDVLQQLKATPETAPIPVVICSVLHEPELAASMGASDYLTKPVQQADLLALLDRFLARPTAAT